MAGKPKSCSDCPNVDCRGFIRPTSGPNTLLFDRPSADDVRDGVALSGERGALVRKVLSKAGLAPENFRIQHLIQCNGPITPNTLAHCAKHREWSGVITAWGEAAFLFLTGEENVDEKRGYEYSFEGHPVIGTYDPQEIVNERGMHLIPTMLFDLKYKPRKLGIPCGMQTILDPSPSEFTKYVDYALTQPFLVVDIETAYSSSRTEDDLDADPSSTIFRVSFAADCKTAVSIPYTTGFREQIDRLLADGHDKVFWNADFDVPRLRHNSHIIGGRIVDAMWLWHFLQPDLPRGLGHAATYYTDLREWKSKSNAEPAYYSACDAYATANIYLGVMGDLRERGMLGLADQHVTELLQVLRRMSARGICLDGEAVRDFQRYLSGLMEGEQRTLNESVPDECRNLHPKQKDGTFGFIREPKDTSGMVKLTVAVPERTVRKKLVPAHEEKRWAILEEFSPNSSQQVKAYMKAVGITVPYSRKEKKETTGRKFLERLVQKDPVFSHVLEYRKLSKMRGTYASWEGDADGMLHPFFSLAPATGRLSCLRPNMQNIPKEGELADTFKRCLVAAPGYVLVRRDYVGAESILTGFFAHDPTYMDLATKGIYTFVMAEYLRTPVQLNDPLIREKLAEIKAANPSLYKKFKTCVLGIGYGLGPDNMFEQNPGLFESKSEARKLRKFILRLFPKIAAWQKAVVNEARVKCSLENPFGYIRWFWDIPGLDSTKAMAQQPQSTLAAIIKEAMLRFDRSEFGHTLILQIHDELVIHCREEEWEAADERLREIMEAPIPQLGGLILRTERKYGKSLA